MSRVAEFARQCYQKSMEKGFGQCMKHVQLLSTGNGKCKAQFTVVEDLLNIYGSLHGGFISTAIDVISTYALLSEDNATQKNSVSVDVHVTYLKAAFPGETVTVDAKTVRAGKNLAFLAVELTKNNGKDVVARGQHTKYFIP